VAIAAALNKIGVVKINGDMIVSSAFTVGYNSSSVRSGAMLHDAMDASRRSAATMRAWMSYQSANQFAASYANPSVVVTGKVSTEELPTNLRLLVTHDSSPLKDILKACLSYSNNFVAERLGDAVGGSFMVSNIVREVAKIAPEEFYIASSSGLGINRVTPRAMMRVFRALHNELAKYKMSVTDILPVAGIDEGTLKNRFFTFPQRASVIAKTGTLPNTDGGVSTLVGQMGTKNGMLFFVIFNQRGNVNRFRDYQNDLVTYLQNQNGGAVSFQYIPKSYDSLLANTRVTTEKTN
jgi:D-alanyl-D-alanine carboxypeptidase/D-alanyl-D-alanine-endopeptidase (penicillin-binding protein 4)